MRGGKKGGREGGKKERKKKEKEREEKRKERGEKGKKKRGERRRRNGNKAIKQTGINNIAIAGGVSANTELRKRLSALGDSYNIFIPKFEYCTDNAAMIAIAGYFKFFENNFAKQNSSPKARMKV